MFYPNEEVKLKVSLLPSSPGVYRYYDKNGIVIYVGKAKNLKRRVSSYFNKFHDEIKTTMLVRHIADLQYTVVNSEEEALDLENSLIKEYKPHYNILLKDDKSYPWICVTKELYPRVFMTRDNKLKHVKYYGPYPKVEAAYTIIDAIRKIYPIRTCRYNVSRETIEQNKIRLCLQYHIKRCEGCCKGLVSPEKYGAYIDEIKQILNGDTKQVSDLLRDEMEKLAGELRFEDADKVKRKYMLVEGYRARSVIVNPSIHNIDVFSLVRDEQSAYVNFMHIRSGSIVQTFTLEYKLNSNDVDDDADIMGMAIDEIHHRFAETYKNDKVTQTVVNIVPNGDFGDMEFIIPQRGEKRSLLAISLKNAEQFQEDKYKRMEKLNPEQRVMRTLTTIQRDFRLKQLPRHIECFDNSNIQGAAAVASCVVFRDAKPSKREYRHFNIETVNGIDDFASMREVVYRRYSRLVDEGSDLPQLLVVDGGKGQLSAAEDALTELGLQNTIAAVGIAKRLEEIYFPGDAVPLYIDKRSETLGVVQHIRDEAHRFAITFHRKKRSKQQVHSQLDEIKGVGPKTKLLLLKHFKSLKRIKEATLEQLQQAVGEAKGKTVYDALNGNKKSNATTTHQAVK